MANVYDVKVRFMRRMQIREYEPSESEVTISAQLSEDDDHKLVLQQLILDTRELVKSALTGKTVGKTETKIKFSKEPTSITPNRRLDDDEIPGDDGPSAAEIKKAAAAEKRKLAAEKRKLVAAKKKAEKQAAASEIPDDDIPSDDIPNDDIPGDDISGDEELSESELHEYINSMVITKKIKPKQIKAIIAVYGAARISEIPEENRMDVKEAIELLAS